MNLHWFDVRESYFNTYHQHLGGGYRAPEGKIYNYDEVKKSAMYQKPFYKEVDKTLPMKKLVTTCSKVTRIGIQ